MNTISNFYDNLDLKYPEIGIAMDRIDRINPGYIRFIIPILTPNLDTTKIVEQKARQNKTNLMNTVNNVEIENIEVSNFVKIKMPRELCTISDGEFEIEGGTVYTEGVQATMTGGSINSLRISGNIRGSGSVYDSRSGGGSIDVNGSVSGSASYSSHTGALTFTNGHITDTVFIKPAQSCRYIEPPSKWIIIFIGGDITKPRVLCRYEE